VKKPAIKSVINIMSKNKVSSLNAKLYEKYGLNVKSKGMKKPLYMAKTMMKTSQFFFLVSLYEIKYFLGILNFLVSTSTISS